MRFISLPLIALCAAFGGGGGAAAQTFVPARSNIAAQTFVPARSTIDLGVWHSNLSSDLPQGEAITARGVWRLDGGHVLQAEALEERRFGSRGGVLGAAYTRVFSPDWYGTGTVALGHGGPNWATWRVDAQISRKWLAERQLVTSAALYYANYRDNGSNDFVKLDSVEVVSSTPQAQVLRAHVSRTDRSDRGLRLSTAWYLPFPAVLEAGITFNRSEPGNVYSHMPYVAATYGREGEQYLSLRVASGTEAYQALALSQQLVDFRSDSVGLTWRRWLGPRWGFTAQGEAYRNSSYRRQTLGVGLFAQWP